MAIVIAVEAVIASAAFLGFIHSIGSLKPEEERMLEGEAQVSCLSSIRKKMTKKGKAK